ncbi:surface lipoprotein assembly modifier [Sphingomonas sp. RS2018]
MTPFRSTLAPLLAGMLAGGLPAAAYADPAGADCSYGICQVRLTPEQLLARAESLVAERRFAEAKPLIQALEQATGMLLPSRFLAGYSAAQQGDYARAAGIYKAILADDPGQTRVRLELAHAMLQLGQTASADRQFRMAEQSGELPPDVAAAIRGVRQVIRSRRAWRFDVDVGIAPDSNINNATGASQIDLNFGDTVLPVDLDGNARARSGNGQTATISTGLRLPFGENTALLAGVDTNGTNYAGKAFDDYLFQTNAGVELSLTPTKSVSLEGVAAQRWFGGHVASRQFGARIGGQFAFGTRNRLGLQLDSRHTDAAFDANFSGWQSGLYATGERAIGRNLVASLGVFGRRDALRSDAYSNTELGTTLGLGGELPFGINFGVSGSVSRATFDAAMPLFSTDPRRDWRYNARVTVGNRKLRVLGFSPQMTLSYARNSSTVRFFTTDRLRLRFAVARYF